MPDGSPTVPLFGPDGKLYDIPYEGMHDALQSGGKMAVHIQDPTGNSWYIPADQTVAATKAGGKIIPYDVAGSSQQQKGAGGEFKTALGNMVQGPNIAQQQINDFGAGKLPSLPPSPLANDQLRAQEGRSPLYRIPAAAIELSGLANPRQMEEAANRGDTSGVLGAAAGQALPY